MRILMAHASIALLLLIPSLSTASEPASPPSGIAFDHALHVTDMEMECDTCHAVAWTSKRGTDVLRPEKAICADCHDVEDFDACGTCHVDGDDPAGYAEIEVKVDLFSHAAHVEAGYECAACHGADPAALRPMPTKAECRSCHVTASDLQDCGVCHSAGAEYVPSNHGPGWEWWHGVEAGHDSQACSNCHAQVDCQDCHSGDNVRPRSHALNFAFNHAVQARANETECATCHSDASFCSSCHVAEQVLPRNHSRADWVMPSGDGGAHSIEATFDIEGCVACHDAGPDSPICANCHGR